MRCWLLFVFFSVFFVCSGVGLSKTSVTQQFRVHRILGFSGSDGVACKRYVPSLELTFWEEFPNGNNHLGCINTL